jgi:predicted Zn-ribbon and HTH transcriptional regulator
LIIFVVNITVLVLIPLYGTYLDYCIVELLKEQKQPLSVKEIAAFIFVYDNKREQRNLQIRIRGALERLDDQLLKETAVIRNNLVITKYKLKEDEKGPEFP